MRYSLRTLLVSVALGATIFMMLVLIGRHALVDRQVRELSRRNHELQTQLGIVAQVGPEQIGVLTVRQPDRWHWKWRVRVPPGTWLRLKYRFGDVPEEDLSASDGSMLLEAGRSDGLSELELHVHRDPSDGRWYGHVRFDGATARVHISETLRKRLDEEGDEGRALVAGRGETELFNADEQVVLLRHTFDPQGIDGTSDVGEKNLPRPDGRGIRMWFEVDPTARVDETGGVGS